MSSYPLTVINSTIEAPSPTATTFTLTPPTTSPTDIWRKPLKPYTDHQSINSFSAPIIYKRIALPSFQRLRVTVSASWAKQYDQGGLVFILPSACAAEDGGQDASKKRVDVGREGKWVKTGIEFYEGQAYVSTVTCEKWADWSLVQEGIREEGKVTLEMERKEGDDTLWVYVVKYGNGDGKEERIPVREVTWAFCDGGGCEGVDVSKPLREAWVGVYAATPNPEEGRDLEVLFEGFEVVVKSPEQMR